MRYKFLKIALCMLMVSLTLTVTAFAADRGIEYTIDSLKMYDGESHEQLWQIPTEVFLVEAKITNICSKSADTVMVATYSDEGQMVGLHYLSGEAPSIGKSAVFEGQVDNTDGKIGIIKAFVVPSAGAMVPLAGCLTVENTHKMTVTLSGNTAEIIVEGELSADDGVAVLLRMDGVYVNIGNAIYTDMENGAHTYIFENDQSGEAEYVFQLMVGGKSMLSITTVIPGKGSDLPWENGGKLPLEYTWAEFEALTGGEQMAFQNWFGSMSAFEAWMEQAQSAGVNDPWEVPGAKQPSEYTWTEFQSLGADEQMAFQNWFAENGLDFAAWMEQAQAEDVGSDLPWENGGKLPSEYTWTEFQSLGAEEQLAFQNWFDSMSAFEVWMEQAQSEDNENQWNGSKLPSEYTWAEFESLSAEEQMAFQNWFESDEAFIAWMEKALENS